MLITFRISIACIPVACGIFKRTAWCQRCMHYGGEKQERFEQALAETLVGCEMAADLDDRNDVSPTSRNGCSSQAWIRISYVINGTVSCWQTVTGRHTTSTGGGGLFQINCHGDVVM